MPGPKAPRLGEFECTPLETSEQSLLLLKNTSLAEKKIVRNLIVLLRTSTIDNEYCYHYKSFKHRV